MEQLLPTAEKIATRLIERKETIAIAEGSAGGRRCAEVRAVGGASA
jgi:nicotinamide mononucleotide (NMN) deamidase PncC